MRNLYLLNASAAIAAIFAVPAAANAQSVSLTCTESNPTVDVEGSEEKTPGSFGLAYQLKGKKLGKINVSDPHDLLDPLGKMPVFSGGRGPNGGLVMTQGRPPKRGPMKLKGKAQSDGSLSFINKVPMLTLTLSPTETGYDYTFIGSRLLSGTFRAQYDGEGTCTVTVADGSNAS